MNIVMPPSARSPFMPRMQVPIPMQVDDELRLSLTRAMVLCVPVVSMTLLS